MKRKKSDHPKDSLHEHAPGWNETLASESEAHVKVPPYPPSPPILRCAEKDFDDRPTATKAQST